jgi:uncharacterized cupin superfamily protein
VLGSHAFMHGWADGLDDNYCRHCVWRGAGGVVSPMVLEIPSASLGANMGAIRGNRMGVKLIRFGSNPPAIETGMPGNVISGNPSTKLQNYYTDQTGQFFAGIWESAPGKWQVSYGEEEFCAILAGKAVLTNVEGVAETFQKGDAFVIPKGFTGSWETIEAVKKWYVIFEPKV